jgi:hypothetical protein
MQHKENVSAASTSVFSHHEPRKKLEQTMVVSVHAPGRGAVYIPTSVLPRRSPEFSAVQ